MPENHYIIFSANYLPSIGGVERFTNGLALELARRGKQATIVTNNVYGLSDTEDISDNVSIVRLPCYPLIGGRMPIPRINKRFIELWHSINPNNCSGILVNTRFYAHSILGLRLAKQLNITPILLEHGSAYLTFGNQILDIFVRAYEHIITSIDKHYPFACYAISNRSAEWLNTFHIQASGVINNAIDASEYRSLASKRDFRKECNIPTSHLIASFTGRLIPEKGIVSLVDAFSKFEDQPIHLLIAGDGPLLSYVKQHSTKNVSVLGPLQREDVAALMSQSDVFCLPTRSEGFSTSLLEACACGAVPIITNVGGVDELLVDEGLGYILEDNSPRSISSALKKVIEDREQLPAKGKLCMKRVEETFSWSTVTDSFIEACAWAN